MFKKAQISIVCQITILLASAVNYFFNPQGLQVGDSLAYGFGSDRNLNLLSPFGNSLRNWPVVSINLLIGDSALQILMQTVFSVFAWVILIRTYNKSEFLRKQEFSIVATLLFLTSQNLTWNSTQLSESYSISFVILILSQIIKLKKQNSFFDYFLIILLGYLWASIHGRNLTSLILFVILFVITYFTWLISVLKFEKFTGRKVVLALIAVAFATHALVVNSNQRNQDYEQGLGYKALAYTYTFASQPEAPSIRKELLKIEDLKCLTLDGSADLYALTNEMKQGCKSANIWLNENFTRWYAGFLISHPVVAVKMAIGGLLYGNQPPVLYGPTLSILPSFTEEIFFGNAVSNLANDVTKATVAQDSKINSPLLLWVILLIVLILTQYRELNSRILLINLKLPLVISFGSILSAILTVLICPAEYFKLTIQMQILFYLSSIIVILNSLAEKKVNNE